MKVVRQYYKTDEGNNFDSFLRKCKYAMKKCFGYDDVRYDFWSMRTDIGTFWETLKKTGRLDYIDNSGIDYLIVIDFEFENHIYAELQS